MSEFQEIVEFMPAYDKRDPDPKKNYGIHGVTLRMVLKGPAGAVQFVLYTNWLLPHVQKEINMKSALNIMKGGDPDQEFRIFHQPMASDLGYHSPKPMYEGQKPMGAERISFEEGEFDPDLGIRIPKTIQTGTFDPCELLDGAPCYYDGSTLNAEPIYKVLLTEGSKGVWRELRSYYDRVFEDGPCSD